MPNPKTYSNAIFQNGFFQIITSSLLCISIIIFIILFTVKISLFDESLFKKEFEKHNVYSALNGTNIESINKEVIDYLNGKSGPKTNFFTEREKAHLSDVRSIIHTVNNTFLWTMPIIILLSFILFMSMKMKSALVLFAKIMLIAGILIMIMAFLFVLTVSLDFQSAFDRFHKTFFKSETWLFNPSYEKIVVLYPEGLFYDFGMRIIMLNLIFSGMMIFFSLGTLLIMRLNVNKYAKDT